MEPMDYFSDVEVKSNISHSSNSDGHTVNRSGYSLQGVLDAASSLSSAQIAHIQETSQESHQDTVGEMCRQPSIPPLPLTSSSSSELVLSVPKPFPPPVPVPPPVVSDNFKPHSLDPRPCPECGRVYSNISNLRQHIRLIHYPECITCPLCFKPFKNKLYLRRHVMSYHEINLPSQNDMRYKYMMNNKVINSNSPVDSLAALFAPTKSADDKITPDKMVPMAGRYSAEHNVHVPTTT